MGNQNLLLQILLYPAMGQPSGMRVYEDGLYCYMKGSEGWSDVWHFTDEEMVELRHGIASANVPSLKIQYDAGGMVSDGTTTVWSITVDGQQYRIQLAPGAEVPALKKLFHTFSTLRKLSPEHSHWHVWQPDGLYRDFTVVGSVNAVDALRLLVHALFVAPSTSTDAELVVPANTLLVKTEWVTESQTEITKLFADGMYTSEVDGKMKEEIKLPFEQVLNVVSSIQNIDWASIPELIDTT